MLHNENVYFVEAYFIQSFSICYCFVSSNFWPLVKLKTTYSIYTCGSRAACIIISNSLCYSYCVWVCIAMKSLILMFLN